MAGYKLHEHEPYEITGKTGTVYKIPAIPNLSVDEIGYMVRFNESKDAVERRKSARNFSSQSLLTLKPKESGTWSIS